jgi:hypothetical protein
MKLFDFFHQEDYGQEIYLTIGQFENLNILDASFLSTEYWSWEPDIRLTFEVLAGTLFTIRFSAWSFSFDLDLISYRSPFNLSHTRDELYFDPFE